MPDTETKIDLNAKVVSFQEQRENKFDRIRKTQNEFIRASGMEKEDLDEISDSFRAYEADSWPKDRKAAREADQKPADDIARFPNIIDVISGNQIQARTQPKILPFEEDDLQTATFLNLYLQYRRQKQNLDHADSSIFKNGLISKRSHREYKLKVNRNDGSFETIATELSANEVFIVKPFREIDASDASGIFHAQWVSPEKIKKRFPNIDPAGLEFRDKIPEQITTESTHLLDEYLFPSDNESDDFFRNDKNQVRIIKYWKKQFKLSYRVVNNIDPEDLESALIAKVDTKTKAMEAAAGFLTDKGAPVNEETILGMIHTENDEFYSYHVISGRVELIWEENWGEFVPISHYFSYWANGRAHGLWSRLKDEIRSLNFLWNKLVERLGTSGWMPIMIEDDAISDRQTPAQFLKNWRDGKAVFVAPGTISKNKVKIEQDHSLQSIGPYVSMIQFMFQNLDEKSGATESFRGVSPGANTAGIAIEKLQQKGAAVVEPVFDNFRAFQREDALMEIKMLNRAFEKKRLLTVLKMERIVGGVTGRNKDFEEFGAILQEGVVETSQGDVDVDLEKILARIPFIEYDANVTEAPSTPSLRIAQLQAMAQLAGATQIPIPPQIAIELFDFIPPELKQKWLQALAQIPQEEIPPTNGNI